MQFNMITQWMKKYVFFEENKTKQKILNDMFYFTICLLLLRTFKLGDVLNDDIYQ